LNWQPSAHLERLRRRAQLLATTRQFFSERGVLEVETPLLCSAGVTDPAIEPLTIDRGVSITAPRYLQTSPEYAMKRLLAAHGEPIWQLARAFRDGEAGSRHNPEFTLLEWYRPGFSLEELMVEVIDLVAACLGKRPVQCRRYRDLFREHLDLDPMTASDDAVERLARARVDVGGIEGDRDLWLDLLMSHLVEPQLEGACLVHDYPASQAALARVEQVDGVAVARRFELYVDGLELANGYHELADATEQRRRFDADNRRRAACGQPEHPVDEYLLAALEHGLPDCCGVALGFDRLLMLATGVMDIREVQAFDWNSA
jgi:lysyl-tRNA synthetase class 2